MISLSNLFEVLGVNRIRAADGVNVPISVSRFIAAQNQVSVTAWVECEENAVGPPVKSDAQFFQVRKLRSVERINVWPSKFRTMHLDHSDAGGDTCPFFYAQAEIPRLKLVADLNFPSHIKSIPLR
jgi:hypothetical protein